MVRNDNCKDYRLTGIRIRFISRQQNVVTGEEMRETKARFRRRLPVLHQLGLSLCA